MADGVDHLRGSEAFEGPESVERPDNFFWFGEDGDWLRLETGAGSLAGFELAIEDNGGKWEFLFGEV